MRNTLESMIDRVRSPLGILAFLALFSWLAYAAVALQGREFVAEQPLLQRPILTVLGLLGAAFACYLAAIFVAVRIDDDEDDEDCRYEIRRLLWLIVGSSIVFRITLLFSWPIENVDVYRYLWDGAATACGASPYGYSPQQVASAETEEDLSDDLRRLVQLRDSSPEMATVLSRIENEGLPSAHPPVSQAVFAVCSWITPQQATVLQRLLILKAVLVLFDLATLALVIGLLRCAGHHVGWSLVYGWCPLVIKEIANSGHMDSLPVFLTTSAVLVAAYVLCWREAVDGRWRLLAWSILAAVLLALGVGAKLYPVVLLPLFALVWARQVGCSLATVPTAVFAAIAAVVLSPMIPWQSVTTLGVGADAVMRNEMAAVSSEAVADADSEDPARGLKAVLTQREVNDLIFLVLAENVKPADSALGDAPPWFAVVPDRWRLKILAGPITWLDLTPTPASAVLVARLLVGGVFLGLALVLASRAARSDDPTDWLRAALLTLGWLWLLSPAQNPWYWIWALPLVPMARSKAWLAVSGLALVYYLRFWLTYHWPEESVLGTGYHGALFFDYVVTWLVFGPWLAWLALDTWRMQRRNERAETLGAYGGFGARFPSA